MKETYDKEGFLLDLNQWSKALAVNIAQTENINLTTPHWELILLAREYYAQFNLSPEMRPYIKWLNKKIKVKNINSLYLLKLFPDSPTKMISKIAGLPKPTNCL